MLLYAIDNQNLTLWNVDSWMQLSRTFNTKSYSRPIRIRHTLTNFLHCDCILFFLCRSPSPVLSALDFSQQFLLSRALQSPLLTSYCRVSNSQWLNPNLLSPLSPFDLVAHIAPCASRSRLQFSVPHPWSGHSRLGLLYVCILEFKGASLSIFGNSWSYFVWLRLRWDDF